MGTTLRKELYASGGTTLFTIVAVDDEVGDAVTEEHGDTVEEICEDDETSSPDEGIAAAAAFCLSCCSCSLFSRFSFFFPIPGGAPTVCWL